MADSRSQRLAGGVHARARESLLLSTSSVHVCATSPGIALAKPSRGVSLVAPVACRRASLCKRVAIGNMLAPAYAKALPMPSHLPRVVIALLKTGILSYYRI